VAAVFYLLGGALITAGVALIFVPAAVIVAGCLFIVAAHDLTTP